MKIGLFQSIDISRSGLRSERKRLHAVAENIANVKTTRTEDGTYYKPREISSEHIESDIRIADTDNSKILNIRPGHLPVGKERLEAGIYEPGGVRSEIIESDKPPVRIFDPDHPHAGPDGYVEYPDIDLPRQMGEAITAIRAYEANIGVVDAAKFMFKKALEI